MSRSDWSRLIGPGIATLAMLVALIGLGAWQVQRLHWKQAMLAQIARAEAAPPIALPPNPPPFTRVQLAGHFARTVALYGIGTEDTPAGPVLGAQQIVPLLRADAPPVLVDRGWVPLNAAPAPPTGDIMIQGYIRAPDRPGLLSLRDDVAGRHFYTLDPASIGHDLGLPAVAPFTLVAMGPPAPGVLPIPADHLPQPPNNHLSYAVTWFSLAAILAATYALWARKTLHA